MLNHQKFFAHNVRVIAKGEYVVNNRIEKIVF